MGIEVVGTNTWTPTSGSIQTLSLPFGTAAGDLVIVIAYFVTPTGTNDFTTLHTAFNDGGSHNVYVLEVPEDVGNQQWNPSYSDNIRGLLLQVTLRGQINWSFLNLNDGANVETNPGDYLVWVHGRRERNQSTSSMPSAPSVSFSSSGSSVSTSLVGSNTRTWTRTTALSEDIDLYDHFRASVFFRRGFAEGTTHTFFDASNYPFGTFVISSNTPPNAPILNSPVSTSIDRGSTNRFNWTFSDDDPGDSQSQFQLQARVQGTTSWTVDVTQETPVTRTDIAGGTFTDDDWEWRVRTWDAAGEVGPYSSPEPFTAADPPAGPTITAPTVDETIGVEDYTVEWSAAEQDAYQLRRLADDDGSPDTDTVLFDTGQVDSSGARSRTVNFPTNLQTEHVQVRVLRNALWSGWATARIQVSYTPPETPTAVLTDVGGAIAVAASHPSPGTDVPDVEFHDIFRRVGSGDGIRVARLVAPGVTFTDWTVASAVDYQYRIRAFGDNGTSVYGGWQTALGPPDPSEPPEEGDAVLPTTLPFALA